MANMSQTFNDLISEKDGFGKTPRCTVEWFGATTFRIRIGELVIFADTWVQRPKNIKSYITFDDIKECDYIIISHAHFDHLPGADKIALKTGAQVIANGEAINVLRRAGVPEEQLTPVAGGETVEIGKGIYIKPFPALHCLPAWEPVPGAHHPDSIDSSTVYLGAKGLSTLHITRGMTKGFAGIRDGPVPQDPNMKAMQEYLKEEAGCMSWFDGGQLMYNIVAPSPAGPKSLLFSAHLGCYEGILRALKPKPEVAILGAAGRGNLNGEPFQGSMAEFLLQEVQWLDQPERVIFALHDQAPIQPFFTNVNKAEELIKERTKSEIPHLEYAKEYVIWD